MSETFGWLTAARRIFSAASYRLSLTPRVLPAQRFVYGTSYLPLLRCLTVSPQWRVPSTLKIVYHNLERIAGVGGVPPHR